MSKDPSDPRPKNRKRVRRNEEVEKNTCPFGHVVLEPRFAKKCKVCRYLKNEQVTGNDQDGRGQDGHQEEGIGGNVAREATEPLIPTRSETGNDTPSIVTATMEVESLEAQSSGIVPADGFDPKRDHFRQGRKPWQPTEHLPGTEGKIKVLAQRANLGQDLWHPLDATWGVRRGYGIYHDEV